MYKLNSLNQVLLFMMKKNKFYRGSTNTEVVLAGTLKQPEDASYVEFLTTSSVEFIWRCKSKMNILTVIHGNDIVLILLLASFDYF